MRTNEDVKLLIETYSTSQNLTNGVVLLFIQRSSKNFSKAASQLIDHFGISCADSSLRHNIRRTYDQLGKLKKNVARNWDDIVSFLSSAFSLPAPSTPVSLPPALESRAVSHSPPAIQLPSPKKLKGDCQKCPLQRQCNENLRSACEEVRVQLKQEKKKVASIKKTHNVRVSNQKHKRHKQQIKQLKDNLASVHSKLSFSERVREAQWKKQQVLHKDNNKLRKKLQAAEDKQVALEAEIATLKGRVKDLQDSNKHLETYSEFLASLQEDANLEETIIETTESKKYTENVRLCIYQSLLCQVPVFNAGRLLEFFGQKLGQARLSRVPSPSTIAQMAHELGILSLLQLTEFLLSQTNLTLSWDATSLDGDHINEIHVTANITDVLILDVRKLPGAKASDYTDHILAAFAEAASVYAKFENVSEAEITARIHSAIGSTVTDRAPVNHCVVVQLNEAFGSQLLELNCNVHPLDGLAISARQVLANHDKEMGIKGACFGKSGCAANVIHAVSKLRFKQGVGDPTGFKSFLQRHNIPVGTFVRYVGNRMHVLFHLAGIIVAHISKLKDFLQNYCSGAALRSAVLKDLGNPHVVVQLTALGIMGKLITGPWMTKFYADKANLAMVPLIKACRNQLDRWNESQDELLHPTVNVFGEPLQPEHDVVLSALLVTSDGQKDLSSVLRRLLEGFISVLDRQLHRYLHGELSDPTDTMLEKASSAPTHNIASERALGMTDALWRRAPNASMGFLNSKVKARTNRTLEWLEKKPEAVRSRLIGFAVSEGYRCRKLAVKRKAALEADIKSRQDSIARQRDKAHRGTVSEKVKEALSKKNSMAEVFEALSQEERRRVHAIIEDDTSIISALIEHTWEDSGKNIAYYGRVQSVETVKTRKLCRRVLTIAYWKIDSPECSSEDYDMPLEDILTDLVLGDLTFV